MKKYKLYLEGVSYIDEDREMCNYKITTSRDSKKAALTYQRNATITNMSNKVVSKAILLDGGRTAINVTFDPNEYRGDKS